MAGCDGGFYDSSAETDATFTSWSGALRLARFNVLAKKPVDSASKRYFVGLPIPAGAGVVAAPPPERGRASGSALPVYVRTEVLEPRVDVRRRHAGAGPETAGPVRAASTGTTPEQATSSLAARPQPTRASTPSGASAAESRPSGTTTTTR